MATSNIVNTLGAGSGIDIKTLAENLVEAERAPRKQRIDDKIAQTEAKISGYSAVKFALSELKSAFEKLNDASDFASLKVSNSQPTAFGVTTSTSAATGSFSLQVSQVAKPQRSASDLFTARDTSLNGGAAFDLRLTVGSGSEQTISVTTATPAGMVSAINGAKLGVTAQLLNTGSGYKVVVTGEDGAAKSFTLSATQTGGTTAVADVSFGATPLQTAQDAQFTLNGLAMTRSSNSITDAIDGVTLDLYTETSGAARLDFNRDTSGIKDQVKALVTAYKDFDETLKVLGDRESEVETFGGALAGDNLLQNVRNQVRSLLTSTSDTPGTTITAARNVGLSFDRNGMLQLDETKLDAALQDNFDEVVQMFSAGTNNQSVYSVAPAGLAGKAVKSLDEMLRSTGLIDQQSASAQKKIADYESELEKLQDRMDMLLNRYMQQFAVMESIVGNSNSLRTSLKGTFEGMMNAYKN